MIPDIETANPSWFQALTGHLSEEQRKELQNVSTLANQRKAAQGKDLYLTHNFGCHTKDASSNR